MNWLQRIKEAPKLERTLQEVKALAVFSLSQKSVNEAIEKYQTWDLFCGQDRFLTNGDVYAVISKIAQTCARLPMYTYEVKPDAEKKHLNRLNSLRSGQYIDGAAAFAIKSIQIKALSAVAETDPVEFLLNDPNPYQSRTEFLENVYHWRVKEGEYFIYKNRLGMGANAGKVKEMYVLQPQYVGISATNTFPKQIVGYSYIVPGTGITMTIAPEDMIHGKSFNPEDELRGLSPLRPGSRNVQRGEAAEDVSVRQLQNGGIPGIVYNEEIGADEVGQDELNGVRNAYDSYVRNPNNKGKLFWAAGRVGVAQTGSTLTDLAVLDGEKYSFKKFCNLFGISDILFNSDTAATESNVQQKQKELYTVVALPLAYGVAKKLTLELCGEFADKKRIEDIDLSGIAELQDDLFKTAQALAAMPVTPSVNEMREMINYERSEGLYMDEPLIKDGYKPISFLTEPEPFIIP
jgi:HK97 family phage portal protein